MRSTLHALIPEWPKWTISTSHGHGIVDGGASGHIISSTLALQLHKDNLITFVDTVHFGSINVMWGGGSSASVRGIAYTNGIIRSLFVVDDADMPHIQLLISEPQLSKQNVIFIKGGSIMVGLMHGVLVLYAELLPSSSGDDSLYLVDVHSLFTISPILQPTPSSLPVVEFLTTILESAHDFVHGTSITAFSARPTYSQQQVRQAWKCFQGSNNINANRIADVVKYGAMEIWSDG